MINVENNERYQKMRAADLERVAIEKFPYVEFITIQNKGRHDEAPEPYFYRLDGCNGDLESVTRLAGKGWHVLGYGNLVGFDTVPGATTLSEAGQEHVKIKQYVDTILAARSHGYAQARKELSAADAQKETIHDKAKAAREKVAKEGA